MRRELLSNPAGQLLELAQQIVLIQAFDPTFEMTMRYAHLSPETKNAAVQLLDELPARHMDGTWTVGQEKTSATH